MRKASAADIVFEASEDLLNMSKTQHVLLKNSTRSVFITLNRSFVSYCYEFCGMTGLSYETLRFQMGGRDVNPQLVFNSKSLVKVSHTADFYKDPPSSLKSSMNSLFTLGAYHDVQLIVCGEKLPVHKCILSTRSPKFGAMFETSFAESNEQTIEIKYNNPNIFKLMIQWIYCGEVDFPQNIDENFQLLTLADEYLLEDLKLKCEEVINSLLNDTNIVKIIIAFEKNPIVSPGIQEKAKNCFCKNFDKILKNTPDLEGQIASIPGLMTKLFLHLCNKKKKRHVTFADTYETEQTIQYIYILRRATPKNTKLIHFNINLKNTLIFYFLQQDQNKIRFSYIIFCIIEFLQNKL